MIELDARIEKQTREEDKAKREKVFEEERKVHEEEWRVPIKERKQDKEDECCHSDEATRQDKRMINNIMLAITSNQVFLPPPPSPT